jgi:curved DNA-binding protein CbpA
MNLARHYRTLDLHRGASSREVKAAYRKLVRQYHPDINPDQAAVERFIQINDAYTALSEALATGETHGAIERQVQAGLGLDSRLQHLRQTLEKLGIGNFNEDPLRASAQSSAQFSREQAIATQPLTQPLNRPEEAVATAQPRQAVTAQLSAQEDILKQEAYQQLRDLLKQQKFPRATALVEGLAHRMPNDTEIIQWQAIVYQRWGRRLIDEGQPQKARIYLKKALRTDPNNPSLWREINHDFWQLAHLGAPAGAVL